MTKRILIGGLAVFVQIGMNLMSYSFHARKRPQMTLINITSIPKLKKKIRPTDPISFWHEPSKHIIIMFCLNFY